MNLHEHPAPQTSTQGSFSIVIPAWNEAEFIEATIDSANSAIKIVIDDNQNLTAELIVVDNNSSDGTASIAISAGATVVFEPMNQIARARNTGARASTGEWLIFLDADTILKPALLKATIQVLENSSAIGGGSTVEVDTALTGITKSTLKFWNWYSVRFRAAAGCYLFCRKDAFDHVGGFDEKQYAAEELYLSKKLRKLGKKRDQEFVVLRDFPVISSARKMHWYSGREKLMQVLLLLIPGSTRSKKRLHLWYDRSDINDNN